MWTIINEIIDKLAYWHCSDSRLGIIMTGITFLVMFLVAIIAIIMNLMMDLYLYLRDKRNKS